MGPFKNITFEGDIAKLLQVHLWDKGVFLTDRLRKGYDSKKMNFRDMGPFKNASDTHGNIGFDLSDPPRALTEGILY